MSKCVDDTLSYIIAGRGNIPVRVYWALECAPLEYRTFGGQIRPCNMKLTDETIEQVFGGNYLLTLVTGSVVSRFLHAQGSVHTLYTDGRIRRFFQRHGLTLCGLWDSISSDILDRELYTGSYNYMWAYSACKPYATLSEISLSGGMPILFHDSDLILRKASDMILGLRKHDDIAMGVGHIEAVGTKFYPAFEDIPLPSCFELSDGKLIDNNTGLSYSTNLPAVNTSLMYFSDMEAAHEWSLLFMDLMKNHANVSDFLTGETLLLCADQRPGMMVAERRGLRFMKEVGVFVPVVWTGTTFEALPGTPRQEWHYYRPEYLPPEKYPEARYWYQNIMHTWIQKRDIELDTAYENYMGLFMLELLERISVLAGLSWNKLEESLRSFPSLSGYFEIYDSGSTLDELLSTGKISNVLRKDLEELI